MARLHKVSALRRGYKPRQVDAALALLEECLSGARPVAAADVRRLGFDLSRGGYETAGVDRLLDRFEQRIVEMTVSAAPTWHAGDELGREIGLVHEELSGPAGDRFSRVSWLRKGYSTASVDALVDRCLGGLGGSLTGVQDPSADDVRLSAFSRRRRGYREGDVDETFDRIIDLLLRQAALRDALAPRRDLLHGDRDELWAAGDGPDSTAQLEEPIAPAAPVVVAGDAPRQSHSIDLTKPTGPRAPEPALLDAFDRFFAPPVPADGPEHSELPTAAEDHRDGVRDVVEGVRPPVPRAGVRPPVPRAGMPGAPGLPVYAAPAPYSRPGSTTVTGVWRLRPEPRTSTWPSSSTAVGPARVSPPEGEAPRTP